MSPTFTPQKVVYFVELFPNFSVDSSDNFIISNKIKPFKSTYYMKANTQHST